MQERTGKPHREIARFLSGQTPDGQTDGTNRLTQPPPTRRGVIKLVSTSENLPVLCLMQERTGKSHLQESLITTRLEQKLLATTIR
jgi:hypothetical protein